MYLWQSGLYLVVHLLVAIYDPSILTTDQHHVRVLQVSDDGALRDKFGIVQHRHTTTTQSILYALAVAGIGGATYHQYLARDIKLTFTDVLNHSLHSRYVIAAIGPAGGSHHDVDHITGVYH